MQTRQVISNRRLSPQISAFEKQTPFEKQTTYPDNRAADYASSLRAGVYGLWRGELSTFDFVENFAIAIERGFTQAWHAGMGECGVLPGDMTEEEKAELQDQINIEIGYVVNFANAVAEGNRDSGTLLRIHTERIPMWVNKYLGIRSLAKTFACADKMLEWVWNPIKEHCPDCLRLNGRVHRASVWRASGWWPRSIDLACGGFRCGCELMPTKKPGTPGRLPVK